MNVMLAVLGLSGGELVLVLVVILVLFGAKKILNLTDGATGFFTSIQHCHVCRLKLLFLLAQKFVPRHKFRLSCAIIAISTTEIVSPAPFVVVIDHKPSQYVPMHFIVLLIMYPLMRWLVPNMDGIPPEENNAKRKSP